MYVRKTVDRWDIETNYGYGWETEVSEYTWKEAKQTFREYRENASGLTGIRIRKRRERIDGRTGK